MGRSRDTWRQCRQNTFARFYQRYVQGFVGQTFIAVAVQLLDRVVQFSGEFYTRRAAADNRNVHFAIRAQVGGVFQKQIQHLLVEATRLVRIIEENAVLFDTWRIEIVRGATQRHYQGVIGDFTFRNQQFTFLIAQFCNSDCFRFTININDGTQLELETMITRMGQIAQRIDAFIKRASRHFVQQRFPQVAVVTIDQRNFGFFLTSQLMPQLCCHFQPTSTAADNHNLFQWRSQRDPLKFINQLLINGY